MDMTNGLDNVAHIWISSGAKRVKTYPEIMLCYEKIRTVVFTNFIDHKSKMYVLMKNTKTKRIRNNLIFHFLTLDWT